MADKIRTLLEQLGGSKELTSQIMEHLEKFKTSVKTQSETDYQQRLEQAKQICLEDVQGYKKELAKKFQVFCESNVERIERQIAKSVAIKESAAAAKLQAIQALLEGVKVNGESDNADLQAAKKQVKELQESNKTLENKCKVVTEKALRMHGITEKTLDRNKSLARELTEALKEKAKLVAESKVVDAPKPAKAEAKPAPTPIAESVKAAAPAKPVSTRRTQVSQIEKPRNKASEPIPTNVESFSPESIAAQID